MTECNKNPWDIAELAGRLLAEQSGLTVAVVSASQHDEGCVITLSVRPPVRPLTELDAPGNHAVTEQTT